MQSLVTHDTFRNIVFFAGLVFLIYGIIVLALIGPFGIFNFFYLCAGVLLILLSYLWKRLANKSLFKILMILGLLVLIVFVIFEVIIVSYANKKAKADADYLIVLGSQIRADGPSNDYKARLDSAYEYLKDNNETIVITTGAQGDNEPCSEAKGGGDYLVSKGLDQKRIIIEDESRNTLQNLDNAKKLIEERGDDAGNCEVVIVSADYHLYRASYIAHKLGYENVSCKGGHGLFILLPQYYTREFFAFIKELITLG